MGGDANAGADAPRRKGAASGRVLRYALVMFFGWILLGIAMVATMQRVLGPAPAPAPQAPRILAAVAPAAPARGARPAPANTITIAANAQGHFFVDAVVNGAPVRFLVDTGASLVALTPADARAAGLSDGSGERVTISTAHGNATALKASLRRLRIDQLELEDVPAVVMDGSLPVSLLGMSFLGRLGGYSIRDGLLTIEW
jgi:aspartyl protease family protein